MDSWIRDYNSYEEIKLFRITESYKIEKKIGRNLEKYEMLVQSRVDTRWPKKGRIRLAWWSTWVGHWVERCIWLQAATHVTSYPNPNQIWSKIRVRPDSIPMDQSNLECLSMVVMCHLQINQVKTLTELLARVRVLFFARSMLLCYEWETKLGLKVRFSCSQIGYKLPINF